MTLVAATLAAAPDLNVKLDALAARVATLLAAHDTDFARTGAVATHLDDAVDARERADRIELMCASDEDAERYAEIAFAGEAPGGVDALFSGEPIDTRDRVRVYVYWGVRKGTDNFATQARAFRAALRGRTLASPGLVTALRQDGSFSYTSGADTWEILARVEGLDTSFRLIDKRNNEYRHEAAITLTLTGAPL